MAEGKIIIFSAPSGAGKTTIVRYLLENVPQLAFSISATTRACRPGETHGKDYYFLTEADFRARIAAGAFVEYEEVYNGTLYGTLYTEVNRIWAEGRHLIADVDVQGGLKLKNIFGDKALSVFVKPPSVAELEARLRYRNTDPEESIQKRVAKAASELKYESEFDKVLYNTNLDEALAVAMRWTKRFIGVEEVV